MIWAALSAECGEPISEGSELGVRLVRKMLWRRGLFSCRIVLHVIPRKNAASFWRFSGWMDGRRGQGAMAACKKKRGGGWLSHCKI